jgi:hypothetical protein
MSENVWIAIAATIAAFIASFGAAGWQIKAMRAMAKPEQKQAKTEIRVSGKVKYLIIKYALTVLGISLPLLALVRELRRPGPLDKVFVLNIVVLCMSITLQLTLLVTVSIISWAFGKIVRRLVSAIESISATGQVTADVLLDLGDMVKILYLALPNKPPQGPLDKLQATLKKLLGN